MTERLVEALDDAALRLLQYAMAEDTVAAPPDPNVEVDAPRPRMTLADRVRAFEAAAGWLETRGKVVLPEKKAAKFDVLKQRFDRSASRRGRAPTASDEEEAAA